MHLRYTWLVAVLASAVSFGAAGIDVSLIEAVKAGDGQTVRTLLKQRSNVNAAEPDGMTALHWAVRANDTETVQLLLRAGANAKAANRYGVTPLSLAAVNGNAGLMEALQSPWHGENVSLLGGECL